MVETPPSINELINKLPRLLTPNEAAPPLRCSPRTVRRMLNNGDLPSVSVGRRRMVPLTAIQQIFQQSA